MKKNRKVFIKSKNFKALFLAIIVLLILLIGFYLYKYFIPREINRYHIENKYYGFELRTPKDWNAQENISYAEENISKILADCENNETVEPNYEFGAYRFQSQKYPQDSVDLGSFTEETSSGAILEIKVNCVPDSIRIKRGPYTDSLKIGGEKTLVSLIDLSGFGKAGLSAFGETRSISVFHNKFEYVINEYVYISTADKNNTEKLRGDYSKVFDKIISSIKFTK